MARTTASRREMQEQRPGLAETVMLGGFAFILVIFGGTAQFDRFGDLLTRFAAVAAVAFLVARWPDRRAGPDRFTIVVIAGMLIVPLLQIIPLPPGLWTTFPGRGLVIDGFRALDSTEPWMPVSLAPLRTFDALLFLIVPIAAFLIALHRGVRGQATLIGALMIMFWCSAVLGVAQMAQGADSWLRFYAITNEGSLVGFFSNRNHFAAFAACVIALATWWMTADQSRVSAPMRRLAAGVTIMLCLVLIVVTESRAGMALGLFAMVLSALVFFTTDRVGRIVSMVAGVAAAGVGVFFLLDQTIARFAQLGEDHSRLDIYPMLGRMVADYFPVGSGIGSFSAAAPRFESLGDLTTAYWNAAHNDYVQIVIESGALGLAVLLTFLIWWSFRTVSVWRANLASLARGSANLRRLGVIVTSVLLLHSVVDYPLRTPALAALFAMACAWIILPVREAALAERRVSRQ